MLGFLILYANQFLIRRRKREFGTYLVLGMTPGHVSRIVLYETGARGLLSLAVGLICGVCSPGLSFFTAALFGTTMINYQFVFSPDAFLVTLACFAAIYVVVAAFNTITVSRCKLIDLIPAPARRTSAPACATRGSASWGSSQPSPSSLTPTSNSSKTAW